MVDVNSARPQQQSGFLKALVDTSFTEWVTLRVAGGLYAAGMVITGLISLAVFGSIWAETGGVGFIIFIIGVPIFWFLGVLLLRLAFEAAIATIAIARNTEGMNK